MNKASELKQQKLKFIKKYYGKVDFDKLINTVSYKFKCTTNNAYSLVREHESRRNAEIQKKNRYNELCAVEKTPKIVIDDTSYFENSWEWKR